MHSSARYGTIAKLHLHQMKSIVKPKSANCHLPSELLPWQGYFTENYSDLLNNLLRILFKAYVAICKCDFQLTFKGLYCDICLAVYCDSKLLSFNYRDRKFSTALTNVTL